MSLTMYQLPTIKAGDQIEIIAPASRCAVDLLEGLKHILTSWQLQCIVNENIFGQDLLCANSDSMRLDSLTKALQDPETKAVICARGGYGSMRLIPELAKTAPPNSPKLFIGMSDITALNLFLLQQWKWPVVHGALSPDKFSPDSTAALKSLIFGELPQIEFQGKALNTAAKRNSILESSIVGGNLSLLQTSIGTLWQVAARDQILFIEEVAERGYRIDRMFEHLHQAGIFKNIAAIILGDFTGGKEPNGSSLVNPVLERFAGACDVPVIRIQGIGHDHINHPLPLGTKVQLVLGNEIKLICFRCK